MSQVNNKRIFKNTAYLYVRMLLGLIVSLITARVILEALGVVDYGLNDVVGGMVTLFSFVGATLSTSTSRFLSYSMGKNEENRLTLIFSTASYIHLVVAILVVVFGETIGVYLVNQVLDIPDDRLFACNVLWQTVIAGAFVSIVQVPLSSLVISYESMNVYAYIGMFDIFARLVIVYLVKYSPIDHLISLAFLNLLVCLLDILFYVIYCKKHFPKIVSFTFKCDKGIRKSMLGFTGWNILGSLANMLRHSGISILLNLFFGPIANAANAIAFRVNNAIMGFTSNFTTAVNPQITKSYAAGELTDMKLLVFRAGKLTYYMLLFLCLPIIFECDYILHLWLGNEIPEASIIMTRLVLVIAMVDSFTYSIGGAVLATGKIKDYQLVISGIALLVFPLSWVLFKMGLPVYTGMVVYLICSIVALIVRLYFVKVLLLIPPKEYICKVFVKTITVTILSLLAPFILSFVMDESAFKCMILIIVTEILTVFLIWFLGLEKNEQSFVKDTIDVFIKRHVRH